jgi:ribosomal protein S18 acetylase RimI-like enzyme
MTQAELDARLPALTERYAEHLHQAGRASADTALDEARRQTLDLLPDGVATPDMLCFMAEDAGQQVGWLWLSLPNAANGRDIAWVFNIEVDVDSRGRGYGRAMMLAAEELLRERGLTRLALNVFGGNAAAIRLYESLGFRVTAQQMVKPLHPPP